MLRVAVKKMLDWTGKEQASFTQSVRWGWYKKSSFN